MRNVILIHLESLNMLNYRMNSAWFPTLRKLENEAVFFSHYYTSATSTLMVMGDIAFGDCGINEIFRSMDWRRRGILDRESVFDDLAAKGYEVVALDYPPNGVDAQSMNSNNFIGIEVGLNEYSDINLYHERINEVLHNKKPFALWLSNFTSHIDFNNTISPDKSGIDRWKDGYIGLDKEVEYIFSLIDRCDLKQNTTIILYGDHGDDFYSHGIHAGLTHAVEPFNHVIHTPLMVLDDRFKAIVNDELICAYDIGKILMTLVDDSEKIVDTDSFCRYIKSIGREYVFSRNMFY